MASLEQLIEHLMREIMHYDADGVNRPPQRLTRSTDSGLGEWSTPGPFGPGMLDRAGRRADGRGYLAAERSFRLFGRRSG